MPGRSSSLTFVVVFAALSGCAIAATAQPADPADVVCPRFTNGATVSNLPELRSDHGVLETTLMLKSVVDAAGQARYCYVTDSGLHSPTLRVQPGDMLIIHLRNQAQRTAASPKSQANAMHFHVASASCGGGEASPGSTNLHFHGMRVSPVCHQDNVVHTAIQTGQSFDYRIRIPRDHPPGVYWYHPHVHGISRSQIEGGASGALIVEGAQANFPSLAGLPERILVLRDQPLRDRASQRQSNAPALDVSLNYVPVKYPNYEPATVVATPGERQFWRVVNASTTTIFDLQLITHGAPQALQVFSLDGVPINGGPTTQDHVVLGPGARVEFAVTTPRTGETAQLITRKWDAGPAGDRHPQRPLANIVVKAGVQERTLAVMPKRASRVADLASIKRTVERNVYFAQATPEREGESPGGDDNDDAGTKFYIFFGGYGPAPFNMHARPNLSVHQGTVEDWVITNTTFEDHVFHIHQLHFQVLEINGKPVKDTALRDTINVPHMNVGGPPPSVKLRMDFRGANVVGTFPYQCHIAAHEEGGMMGLIQVLPPGKPSSVQIVAPSPTVPLKQPISVTAKVRGNGGAMPTGTVQFAIDGVMDGPPVPVSGGRATRSFSFYRPAEHSIRAIYSGDTRYQASDARHVTIRSVAD